MFLRKEVPFGGCVDATPRFGGHRHILLKTIVGREQYGNIKTVFLPIALVGKVM